MEILAVYEENPIRTYGLKAQGGLVWLGAEGPLAAEEEAIDWTEVERATCSAFFQASFHDGRLRLRVCLAEEQLGDTLRSLRGLGLRPESPARPASLIHLQGPHFGDRPGIAASALSSLAAVGVEPLAMSAVVHSLFLLVDPGQAETALRGLSQAFSAPR